MNQRVPANLPGFASGSTIRPSLAAVAQHCHRSLVEHLVFADDAFAASIPAFATASFSQPVLTNANGQIVFDGLNRGVSRIAHMRVYSADARCAGPPAHPAANRLVVGELTSGAAVSAPQSDIVHRAL